MDDVIVLPSVGDPRTTIACVLDRESKKDPSFEDSFLMVDLGDVCKKVERWKRTLPRVDPFYAVKSNDDPLILKTLCKLGTSFDCSSKAEMQPILELGVDPTRIVFSHSVKRSEYLKYAAEKGVDLTVYDNEPELLKIKTTFPNARLLLRIRPSVSEEDVDHPLHTQFGCRMDEAEPLLKRAQELGLNVVGVHFHVGSGIRHGRVFLEAVKEADQVFKMATGLGFSFSILNIGGGFCGHKASEVWFEEIAQILNETLDAYFPQERGVKIIAEPGRFFACSAGTLVINVIGKKAEYTDVNTRDKDCNNTDQNDKVRFLYFVNDGRHGTINVFTKETSKATEPIVLKKRTSATLYTSSVWGPSCDSSDCVFEQCLLPELDVGEWLYIENMGAYSISLIRGSAFNGMPHARTLYVCSEDWWSKISRQ